MSDSRSSTQACAACKYQRRKCGPKCILAPFFPYQREKQFLRAHRLFGVGKITNMIKPLDPDRRNIAIATIIYESDVRAKDPVGGCLRIIENLQSQLAYSQTQLRLLLQHLAFFRPPPPSSSSHPSLLPLQFQEQSKSKDPLQFQDQSKDPFQFQDFQEQKDRLQFQEQKDPYFLLQEDMKLEIDSQYEDAWHRV
ncbi:hypothetical protein VNO80_27978 [Phaseolus coccineus]|uniref:LOB domain-containing protein n=1 Tax=Phaseolus coccineus TaxID=3886 RepID=A0AAN9LLY7_PHACN